MISALSIIVVKMDTAQKNLYIQGFAVPGVGVGPVASGFCGYPAANP
jgi:hypothetical protein